MSGRKEKRRTSILKKRRSIEDDEATATVNTKMQRKLAFSQKKEVLEFAQCEENVTIWGNKYETSVARSEGGSSDGSASNSRRVSDFHSLQITSNSHIVSTTATSLLIESDKENYSIVEKENLQIVEKIPSDQSYVANSSKRISDETPEMSIFIRTDEKLDIKDYSGANLNLTNMPFDSSVLAPNKVITNVQAERAPPLVLSPRKTVFFNRDYAVTVQDKVFSHPQALEERFSLSLEEDETLKKPETRKTVHNPVDMDISTQHHPNFTFKCPEVPKEQKYRKSFSSPPIKPDFGINKQEIDDIYDIIVQDTPTKNLCCLTPQRSAAKAKAMSKVRKSDLLLHEFGVSESKSNSAIEDKNTSKVINVTDCSSNFKMDFSNDNDGTLETTDELAKKASRLLKNPNATLRTLARASLNASPMSSASSTLTLDESLNISKPMGLARSTTYALHDMSVNVEPSNFSIFHDSMTEEQEQMMKPRSTVYYQDMSIKQTNEDCANDGELQRSRATVYDHNISQIQNAPTRATIFNQEMSMSEHFENKIMKETEKVGRETIYHQSMIGDEPKTQNNEKVPKSRVTTFELQGMDESTIENDQKVHKINTRQTIHSTNSMDISGIQATPSGNLPQKNISIGPKLAKNRATFFDQGSMDESKVEDRNDNPQILSKNRATTFQLNEMDITRYEDAPQKQPLASKSRATTFQYNEMDLSRIADKIEKGTDLKPRATTFQLNEMNLTKGGDIPKQQLPSKSRATSFQHYEMDLSQVDVSEKKNIFKPRQTTYEQQGMDASMDLSVSEITGAIPRQLTQHVSFKSRPTTYQNVMDITCNEVYDQSLLRKCPTNLGKCSDMSLFDIPQNLIAEESIKIRNDTINILQPQHTIDPQEVSHYIDKSLLHKSTLEKSFQVEIPTYEEMEQSAAFGRKTMYDQSMEEAVIPSRLTTYENQDINESVQQKRPSYIPKPRATTFEQQEMNESPNLAGGISKKFKLHPTTPKNVEEKKQPAAMSRQTVYDAQMEEEVVPSRLTTYAHQDINGASFLKALVLNHRLSIHQQSEMDMSGIDEIYHEKIAQGTKNVATSESHVLQDAIFTPPSGFRSFLSDSKQENSTTNRQSVIVRQKDPPAPVQRKTSYEHEDMDTKDDRRKTFTVKSKDDSNKWHNVTDADLKLIDESDPCVADESSTIIACMMGEKPRSSMGNISRFEDAIDDFVNLTIVSSPLNTTGNFEFQPTQSTSRRLSAPLMPNRDYGAMLDNLLDTLKKKNEPKPRLAIDEYLEKLQIAPVKIQRRPDLDRDALRDRINAKKEEIVKRREDKKTLEQKRNAMLPEIPSSVFLMRNLLDCMDENIRNIVEKEAIIRPVFPENMNFEFLLKNKFETDEHLLKNWKLDTDFWWVQNLKFIHKDLVFFKISFVSQQTPSEADDSTMPILFSKAILIMGSDFRYGFKFPKKWQMMMNEFKISINGVDNFKSMCRSSSDLLPFLDFYHEHVQKVREVVENFFGIVHKYLAVIKKDKQSDYFFVYKMHFLKPNEEGFAEVQHVKIPVHRSIKDIDVKDVTIKGKLFEYDLLPTPKASSMKGLMLLESILFDIEKFIEGNFLARKIFF